MGPSPVLSVCPGVYDCVPEFRKPLARQSPSRVFVARNGKHELTPVVLTRSQVAELVERMLTPAGAVSISASRSWTLSCPGLCNPPPRLSGTVIYSTPCGV